MSAVYDQAGRVRTDIELLQGTGMKISIAVALAMLSLYLNVTAYATVGRKFPADYGAFEMESSTDMPSGLHLTADEKLVISRNVRAEGGSTLGLGALSEGAEVPHGVGVASFPKAVLDAVPKLVPFRYYTIENAIAIVNPLTMKVALVIEGQEQP